MNAVADIVAGVKAMPEYQNLLAEIVADQLAADVSEEASKVVGYLQWKDAQDAVQREAD